jgi:hypothetical protein
MGEIYFDLPAYVFSRISNCEADFILRLTLFSSSSVLFFFFSSSSEQPPSIDEEDKAENPTKLNNPKAKNVNLAFLSLTENQQPFLSLTILCD